MKSISFVLIMMLIIASGVHSATVLVDPAIQDSPPAGDTLNISVKVKNVVDLYAYNFEVLFDKTAIKLASIEEGDFLKADETGTFFLIMTKTGKSVKDITPEILSDINSAGAFIIIQSRTTPAVKGVDGAGTLIGLNFEVVEAKNSKIEIKNAQFKDEDPKLNPILVDSNPNPIATDITGAVINQPPVCVKGDVNNNGSVGVDDAILILRITAGLLEPTQQQLCAADVNSSGKVGAEDAIIILRKAAGLGAPDKNLIVGGTINIKLDEVYGVAGESITVPLKVDQSNAVAGGDVLIAYDSSVLKAVEVSSDPNILMVSNIASPGIIRVSFASSTGTVGSKLAEIKFDVISDDTSLLTLQNVEFYESNSLPLKLRKVDGLFGSWAMPAKNDALLQNYPNPFNPETWIPFQLKQDSEVIVRIYLSTGELVRELDLGHKSAGMYISQNRAAYWDGKDKFGTPVASGIYFYSVKTKDFSAVRKLTILK